MTWRLTGSLEEFLAAAGDHLRSDPVRNTVPLTVLGALEHRGLAAFGDKPPVFGWHERAKGTGGAGGTADGGDTGGAVDGAFFQTAPFPMWLATFPPGSASRVGRSAQGRPRTASSGQRS